MYAEGEIVDGDTDKVGTVGGDRYARVLRKLRQDPNVKAIVLRVNSPGGSGLASEVIQHELALARAAGKPVVVSMGTVAASGGYWISTAADQVFAEPNTITGSIGVFGMLPNFQGLANNNGVTFDEVKTGKFAALQTASRPKNAEELAAMQGLVEDFYKQFVRQGGRRAQPARREGGRDRPGPGVVGHARRSKLEAGGPDRRPERRDELRARKRRTGQRREDRGIPGAARHHASSWRRLSRAGARRKRART